MEQLIQQVIESRKTCNLLAAFDRGDIDERGLSWLLALHTLDYLELPRRDPSSNGK